jgi:hypothetical protein
MKRQKKWLEGRTMDYSTRKGENKGSKKKDKKIVVIKLKILNKKVKKD